MENGTSVDVPFVETEEDFWEIIRIFQNGILAGNDLFISTPPPQPVIDQSVLDNDNKRKSIEFDLGKYWKKMFFENSLIIKDDEIYLTNGKASKSNSDKESVYERS